MSITNIREIITKDGKIHKNTDDEYTENSLTSNYVLFITNDGHLKRNKSTSTTITWLNLSNNGIENIENGAFDSLVT